MHFGVLISLVATKDITQLSTADMALYFMLSFFLAAGCHFLIEKPMMKNTAADWLAWAQYKGSLMKIRIFELGYVDAVSAVCIAEAGFTITVVDTDPEKRALISPGTSPITKTGLPDIMAGAVKNGHLRMAKHAAQAVKESDVSIMYVGTPAKERSIDFGTLTKVCTNIETTRTSDMEDVLKTEVIVIGNTSPEFTNLPRRLKREQIVVDFVQMHDLKKTHRNYHGICW